jgi:hypothetical protein
LGSFKKCRHCFSTGETRSAASRFATWEFPRGEGSCWLSDDIMVEAPVQENGPMSDTSDKPPGSVSRLLGGLREGDEEAVR